MFCYMMEKDLDSGNVEIYPMNDSDHITIHGVEEAELFTKMLLDCFIIRQGKPDNKRKERERVRRFFYNHIGRHIKQLFPCLYYSEYGTPQDGKKWVSIWKQWFGITIWRKDYLLDPKDRNF